MIAQLMNDSLLGDMDTKDVDHARKLAIIDHLRPLQNQLTRINRTKIPNLRLVYEKGFIKIKAH